MTQYTRFACPNARCSFYAQFNHGNITHRSWGGKNKQIQRLRCTCCHQEFSERKGSIMENSKISDRTQALMLKCLRWGVCNEGVADICEVDIKTVRLNQSKAAAIAVKHHDQSVKNISDAGVQLDEMHCKVTKDKGFWLGAAVAMQSLLIVALTFGERNQGMADRLLAEIVLRFQWILGVFSDGWRPYLNAILKAYGELYRPRRKGCRGRILQKRLRLPDIFYGQVVKIRDASLKLLGVEHRGVLGKIQQLLFFIRTYDLGKKIHTIHIERWFGTLRCCVACCRRRSRCLSKSRERQKQKIWIFTSLYNWVIYNTSLTLDGLKRTPAMAAGLADRQLPYLEYVKMPIFDNYEFRERVAEKVKEMNSDEMIGASRRVKIRPERVAIMTTVEAKG